MTDAESKQDAPFTGATKKASPAMLLAIDVGCDRISIILEWLANPELGTRRASRGPGLARNTASVRRSVPDVCFALVCLRLLPSNKEPTMTADLPPNLESTAASAIVRQAEDARTLETIAKRQRAEQKRIREEAMEAAATRKRTAEKSGK